MKCIFFVFLFCLAACTGQPGRVSEKSAPGNPDSLRPAQHNAEVEWPEKGSAHARARTLLNEDWLFDLSDDHAPFGSDDAADTYAAFAGWRRLHPQGEANEFVLQHLKSWGYPVFDLNATDYASLRSYIEGQKLGWRFLFGTDAAIIATAFGQLYLEGTVDTKIKQMAQTAIKRESSHEVLQSWQEERPERVKKLNRLAAILRAEP